MSKVSDDELIEEVRRTLSRRAGDVHLAHHNFDPDRTGAALAAFDDVRVAASRRSGWLRVAAVAAVAVAAVVVLVVARSGHHATNGVSTTSDAPAPPDATNVPGGLAPSTPPAGVQLWSITWTQVAVDLPPTRTELFGQADGQGGKVLVQVSEPSQGSSACCTPVTVRGQSGQVGPAKEFAATTSEIQWQEDATIVAKFNGMRQADALALLNSLQWRSADHRDGFDASAGSTLVLLDEVTGDAPTTLSTLLDLSYRDTPDTVTFEGTRQRDVRTSEGPGHVTSNYLKTWFDGAVDADGVARSFDPTFGTFSVATSSGRSVWIDANGTPTTEAELEGIYDSLIPQTGAQLLALRTDAERAAASLPLVGRVSLPSAVVEIHGDASARSLCVLAPHAIERCTTPTPDVSDSAGNAAITNFGTFLINHEWFVVYASQGDPQIIGADPPPPYSAGHPDAPPTIASESGTTGPWHVVLAKPQPDLQQVIVKDGSQGAGALRPAF